MTKAKRNGVRPVPHFGTGCRTKICGITNLGDALCAARCGAYFLGFVFYKASSRYISPVKARRIIKALPKDILKVGVFVNEKPEAVKKIAQDCGLDLLQFHGDETSAYLEKFVGCKAVKVVKAVRMKGKISLSRLGKYPCDFFLFDAFKKDEFGGTGKVFDWGLLKGLKKIKKPFFVSGGLSPDNVAVLIKKVRPFAVDVSSGVEKAPGRKDHKLIRKFIEVVGSV